MKFSRKNLLITGLFFLLAMCFLLQAKKTAEFAYIGLKTWFETMIVSLFPFMVLMNLMIRSGFSHLFIRPFYTLLRPVMKNSPEAVFVIFFGFLCGFPLGAKCAIDFYKKGQISKDNAEYLLSFSNNIGPAYMLGFFVAVIKPECPLWIMFFCCYGIPFLYGVLLRHTFYRHILDKEYKRALVTDPLSVHPGQILFVLPDAVSDALTQIASLGGYMVLFNALRIVPHILFKHISTLYVITHSLLEISGGLLCVQTFVSERVMKLLCLFAVFSFNGICCHFQTFALMQGTSLSRQKYMLHKIILCSITVLTVWIYLQTR
ncbi:MAG: hypothetical protein E7289_05225 [Lachnospiraceae bacterium]|nr:hypothetical protein [Lachnospiraceae bacterium]